MGKIDSIQNVNINDLKPYERNAKQHSEEQVRQIADSIQEFGFLSPCLIDKDNNIIAGHGRVAAAKLIGMEEVPCVYIEGLTEEQRRAYILADNRLTELGGWDMDLLEEELRVLTDEGFDIELTGFNPDEFDLSKKETDEVQKEIAKRKLNDFFLIPPFSVLNAQTGYWQERKQAWNVLIGNASETRDEQSQKTYTLPEYMPQINGGTSNFDPVLAETMYLWFNRPGGKILDPFGGEQTKGIVAGELKYEYHGCEIRKEQVEYNLEKTKEYPDVHYYCGDSNNIKDIITERDFDMCFTSPPYYDLEVYSKEDMSALGTYEEFMEQYKNIFSQCYEMLKDNSFLVIKVGEIRDKKTGIYRNFVSDNIKIMNEIGFKYYNELILVTMIGSASRRAMQHMKTRKPVKIHQNVLVFYKGNPEKIHEQVLVFYKGNQKNIPDNFPQLDQKLIEIGYETIQLPE